MNNSATEMLVSSVIEFLHAYPPFDRMEPEILRFLAERSKLAYYPKNAVILSPESGVVNTFRIIQRGKVLARLADEHNVMKQSEQTIGPGEGFPFGSMIARRISSKDYIVLEDLFCFELRSCDFFVLMQKSPEFNQFCTQFIASLLSQSQQQLQMQFSLRVAEQQTMSSPLSSVIKKNPLSVEPLTPLRQVIEQMAANSVGSMIVVDEEQRPIGIFTQSDVLKRVVLPGLSLDTPISEVMSRNPHTLPMTDNAYDAALAMAMRGVHHVLAVDDSGQLKGIVSERDLFALQRVSLRQIRQTIDSATNIDMLLQASDDVHQFSLNMLAQGVGADHITQLISALNDTLTRRIIKINLNSHDLSGIDWTWLAFGSEGRDEQTFSTDQDNGIVFVCDGTADLEDARLRLLAFARDVNADLGRCGFPLCTGNIMASNPDLCLTHDEWEEKFRNWIQTPEPQALLNATIFFDFRPLFGNFNRGERMRASLQWQARNSPLFLRMLAANAVDIQPPLGRIRDFITNNDPAHSGTIDLKKYGARIFIDAARIFALANGVTATNTVQRIKLTAPLMNVLSESTAGADAFNFIQLLRLRIQHSEQMQGLEVNNLLRPDDLNEVERLILKESFRQARKMQQRLKQDFQLG